MTSMIDDENENFKSLIDIEIKNFLEKNPLKNNRVLLFPPVNNYRRFLIHKICENYDNLITFSIGCGIERRTVVCFKNKLIIPLDVIAAKSISKKKTLNRKYNFNKSENELKMGVESITDSNNAETELCQINKYIPPALRNKNSTCVLESNNSDSKQSDNENKNINNRPIKRERRPDRAVYVPRQLRQETVDSNNKSLNNTLSKNKCDNYNTSNSFDDNNKTKNYRSTGKSKSIEKYPINLLDEKNLTKSDHNNLLNIKNLDEKNSTVVLNSNKNYCDKSQLNSIIIANNNSTNYLKNYKMNNNTEQSHSKNNDINDKSAIIMNKEYNKKDGDTESDEFERASKEFNRGFRKIIKQTFNSNVLEIPEKAEAKENENIVENKTIAPVTAVDPENDDWDAIYDDNGDCFDQSIIAELTASVGNVQIETPKADYTEYLLKQAILSDEEFPHVLEISNFPVEFKTHDLIMIFSAYKESGFEIKWVDDTHALAVFSSSRIAAEVLAMHHPFVLLKPLAKATLESRNKAKKCSTSLQPYRARPETCAALARRLVTGALGVRLKTAAQERENEKRVLKEAKERKLLAAKQRDEAWES